MRLWPLESGAPDRGPHWNRNLSVITRAHDCSGAFMFELPSGRVSQDICVLWLPVYLKPRAASTNQRTDQTNRERHRGSSTFDHRLNTRSEGAPPTTFRRLSLPAPSFGGKEPHS